MTEFTLLAEKLENLRWRAMLAGDMHALETCLADDMRFIHASGLVDTKQSYLEKLRNRTIIYTSADPLPDQLIPLGDAAFAVTGTVSMGAIVGGVERRLNSVFLVAWRRTGDAWQLVTHQTTSLPTP